MSGKYALIIGNMEYIDPGLAQLTAPGKDTQDFARILKDQDIGAFDNVNILLNQSSSAVIEVIDEFFDQRKPDDLLLLYFSGHGVRDELGALYLAVKNTIRPRLRSTAIKSDYIREVMDQSRSRRQVVILDCCNSGAFPQGTKAEVGGTMGMVSALQGYGRFVLTASDATQYAWEGNQIIGETQNSLFTHFLVKGLEGEADSDGDGRITIDELYDYAYEEISRLTPKQTPTKSISKQEGEIVLRQNMRIEDIKPVPLPDDLIGEMEDIRPYVREAAVQKLEKILRGKNIGMARSAIEALEKIATDDNTTRRVAQMATQLLESIRQAEKAEEERKAREEAERIAAQKAEEERLAAEEAEAERKAREEEERIAIQKAEAERKARENAERLQKAEAERKEREEAEQLAKREAEEERLARENADAERKANEEAHRLEVQKAEQEQLTAEKEEVERKAKKEAERLARAKAKREAAEKAAHKEAEREFTEKAKNEAKLKAALDEIDRIAAERTAREKAERNATRVEPKRKKTEKSTPAKTQQQVVQEANINESQSVKTPWTTSAKLAAIVIALILGGFATLNYLPGIFLGPPVTEAPAATEPPIVEPVAPFEGTYEAASGGGHMLIDRTLTLNTPVGGTLTFWTWYAIEAEYDYGFVEASTDDGATWTPLPGSITVTSNNPNSSAAWANSLVGGQATTDTTITGSSGGWVEATFTLPAASGVSVRFNYYTDGSENGQGWFIDDVSINGFSDGFEDGTGANWDLGGWTVTTAPSIEPTELPATEPPATEAPTEPPATEAPATEAPANGIVFGPQDGSLQHNADDDTIAIDAASVELRDFGVAATFLNPYSASTGTWDYGFLFRDHYGNDQYRLIIFSDQHWELANHTGDSEFSIIHEGELPNLDISNGGSNLVVLICDGDTGTLMVNEDYRADLDLSARLNSGDIHIGTGFRIGAEINGYSTDYREFVIWEIR